MEFVPMPRYPLASETTASLSASEPAPANHPFQFGKFLGTAFNTYILYDLGQELGLIDQHAADERVRYERLKSRVLKNETLTPQALLIPEAIRFPLESKSILQERLGCFEKWGFEVEIFGEDTLLFRSVPSEWDGSELKARLKGLIERVISSPDNSGLLLDESLFEALASQACHSAVRAGDSLEREESEQLIDSLFACEHPWNCPHGRPTVVRVPKARFEEWFLRRV
jgi:DNA mismatch repair protein MutL